MHLADYLASRKDIEVLFSQDEKVELPKLDTWILPFGKKHKGKTLLQIKEIDPEYILWAKENITSEPARSLLKQL